ncbi:unnamed protein product [Amaranthus hypochondriacus]
MKTLILLCIVLHITTASRTWQRGCKGCCRLQMLLHKATAQAAAMPSICCTCCTLMKPVGATKGDRNRCCAFEEAALHSYCLNIWNLALTPTYGSDSVVPYNFISCVPNVINQVANDSLDYSPFDSQQPTFSMEIVKVPYAPCYTKPIP